MKDSATIKAPVLRELVQATNQVRAIAVGTQGGFILRFQFGDSDKALVNSHGSVRSFASLDTAGIFVRNIGIPQFEVDMTYYKPGRLRGARPDRAEALRQTRTRMRQQAMEFQYAETAHA